MVRQKDKSVLFIGNAYYNHWYLSRELNKLGWDTKLVNTDLDDSNMNFYHGQDYSYASNDLKSTKNKLKLYLYLVRNYNIFHFANVNGIAILSDYYSYGVSNKKTFLFKPINFLLKFFFKNILNYNINLIYLCVKLLGFNVSNFLIKKLAHHLPAHWDVLLIKKNNKKIVYTNNGCLDGVLKSSFNKWSTPDNNPICTTICHYKDREDICSDILNKKWAEFRNKVADYQCLLGGNRVDYNLANTVHECPWVYALDKNFWNPDLLIPTNYLLALPKSTVKLFHSVGNFEHRNQQNKLTIKSTHIYFDTVDKLKKRGFDVELIFFKDVPNKIIRYYQLQADIIVDMLSFGFFGANIREGLMLGKPCVCYLRPEWLEQMKTEIPEYVEELPVISASPSNIEEVLIDLINNPEKRKNIGLKSRAFAEKWHASDVAAKKFEQIYSNLLSQEN